MNHILHYMLLNHPISELLLKMEHKLSRPSTVHGDLMIIIYSNNSLTWIKRKTF